MQGLVNTVPSPAKPPMKAEEENLSADQKPADPLDEVVMVQLFRLHHQSASEGFVWKPVCDGRLLMNETESEFSIQIRQVSFDDSDGKLLFETFIQLDVSYDYRVEGSNEFITWTEPNSSGQFTLSFANSSHCKLVYQAILIYRQEETFLMEVDSRGEEKAADPLAGYLSMGSTENPQSDRPLPACKLENLDAVESFFLKAPIENLLYRRELCQRLLATSYLSELLEVGQLCRNCEMRESSHQMFRILNTVCRLESEQIFEFLLHPQNIIAFCSLLEYDPKVCGFDGKGKHSFLEHMHFTNRLESLTFIDEEFLLILEHTYRVRYFREFIFPQTMEEDPIVNVNVLLRLCYRELFQAMSRQDQSFFSFIQGIEQEPPEADSIHRAILAFLRELFITIKGNTFASCQEIYRELHSQSVLSFFACVLSGAAAQDEEIVHTTCELLRHFAELDSSAIRSQCLQSRERSDCELRGGSLLLRIVQTIFVTTDEFVRSELSDCLKYLIAGCSQTRLSEDEEFLTTLFSDFSTCSIDFVAQCQSTIATETGGGIDENSSDILYQIGELLDALSVYCPTRVKELFGRVVFVDALVSLLRQPYKRMVLSLLRLFRTLLCTKDEFYSSLFLRRNLLTHLVWLLGQERNQPSLLQACVLSIVEKIRTEPCLRNMLICLVESYENVFTEEIPQFQDVFQRLQDDYNRLFEIPGNCNQQSSSTVSPILSRLSASGADSETPDAPTIYSFNSSDAEERYFSSADIEEIVAEHVLSDEPLPSDTTEHPAEAPVPVNTAEPKEGEEFIPPLPVAPRKGAPVRQLKISLSSTE